MKKCVKRRAGRSSGSPLNEERAGYWQTKVPDATMPPPGPPPSAATPPPKPPKVYWQLDRVAVQSWHSSPYEPQFFWSACMTGVPVAVQQQS